MNTIEYFNELQNYATFSPTPFDPKGLLADRYLIGDYKVLYTQTRDSDCLQRSNFRSILAIIGGDSDLVQVHRFSHWACGWFEIIIVSPDVPDELKETIGDIVCGLADYPVLDDQDYLDLEEEEALRVWQNCYSTHERVKYIREHKNQFDFNDLEDMLGCVRGKYFVGHASDLLY